MRERFLDMEHAFDHPVTLWVTVAVVTLLVVSPILVSVLAKGESRPELFRRCFTWAVIAPILIGPLLLGSGWTIALVAVLSIACLREFARVTGLFRAQAVTATAVAGVLLLTFAIIDHWYGFFVALLPLVVCVIAAVAIFADQPKGYVQRVALGAFGFMLIGGGLGHLGYMANDANYRPIVLLVFLGVALNDVFAYVSGKSFGRRKLAPNTSPNKTVEGSLGALVATTALVAVVGHFVFEGTVIDTPHWLVLLGVIVSVAGQLGDLVLSSIKRDVGTKDTGALLPGHGGLLDRFDSLLLTAPAVFHYVGYFVGFGLDQPTRILSGGP